MLCCIAALASCSGRDSDTDGLGRARTRLASAPCGKAPAVSGISSVNPDPHQFYVNDWILVSVCHLDTLIAEADKAQTPISLFIEGSDTGNTPVGIDIETGTLTFILERNQGNRDLWRPYLYDPLFDPEVTMRISVGLRGERPIHRTAAANTTARLRKVYIDWYAWMWLGFLTAVAVLLFVAALRTDMLRDGPSVEGVRRPYSLARSQMAWWFFLTVASYGLIWLITGDRDTIPPSLLGLMGISAATALVAAAISDRKEQAIRASTNWWRDVATNEDGSYALDRVQIIVWTAVLSIIFLTSVIWELTMPEFSPTLLALMGISSGTYVGFKLPQTKTDT